MPVSIVGGFLYAGGLLSCSAQLRDHPEGLRSDLKAFVEAKTSLSRDWAGAVLYGMILFSDASYGRSPLAPYFFTELFTNMSSPKDAPAAA